MENTEGQIPAKAVNEAETNNETDSSAFGVEQIQKELETTMFDDIEDTDATQSENEVESPEVESEGEQESQEVHSESHEETTSEDEGENHSEENEEDEPEYAERGLPKGVKKRIDKLVAKRREAEKEVERMKSELQRLEQEAQKPAQTAKVRKNPYGNLETEEQVLAEAERAKQIRRWCEANPDGAVVRNAKGEETEYSAEDVRKIKLNALDALEEHLPAQLTYVNNFKVVEQHVSKEYPWWKDKTSKERQIADAFIKHFPEITRFPDYKMVLGDYIRGVKAREASLKNAGNQRLPSQPKMTGVPVSSANRSSDSKGSNKRLSSSSGRDDLADIIASKFL